MEKPTEVTRRDAVKIAGAAAVAAAAVQRAPGIQTVRAANDQVAYAVIGTGGRGKYHITHLNGIDTGRCVAVCDIDDAALNEAKKTARDKPQGYKDYSILPREAYYDSSMGEFLLPYDVVRTAKSPDDVLLSFLQSTYEAAATNANWDRHALER